MSTAGLFNGRTRAPDLRHSRALHYGDGVFRTCLVNGGRVVDLGRQLQKLAADARLLGLKPPASALLAREMRRLAAGQRRAVLKATLIRAGSARGYGPLRNDCDRLLLLTPAPTYPASFWEHGIRLGRSDLRLAPQPRLAGIKHLNRLEQVLASRERAGVEEVLMCDLDGRPISGSRSNLFWMRDGMLHTPRLDRCGVSGQMRGKIIAIARRNRLPFRETVTDWKTLMQADEVFVCNSLVGIWPVRQIGRRRWHAPGDFTARLQQLLRHPSLVPA